ncbi:Dihydropteroate synthase [Alteromonadaceae bacterium Bs31]|nr:Dihydropteroate synthase [Alteromonadaceae bacterium Bs31]
MDLSTPKIMGVLNVTPDSFYDGGKHCKSDGAVSISSALLAAEKMVADGAAFIDVGGESTRPGAAPVGLEQECARVLPVVEALSKNVDAVISVDTSSPEIMTESVKLGGGLINDVRALEKKGAIEAAVNAKVPLCLMHMQGKPSTMQHNPTYSNAVSEVCEYLLLRVGILQDFAQKAGIDVPQIILDPGYGFGKTDEHNLQLLRDLSQIENLGYPILAGLSRKSMIGRLLGRKPEDRLAGSLTLAVIAAQNGARIIRAHDVAETADAIRLLQAIKKGERDNGA